MNAERVFIGQ